jgi:hypothetical protein
VEAAGLILATYYVVTALSRTEGPGGVLYKLQTVEWLPFHCQICLAPWAAAIVLLARPVMPEMVSWVFVLAGAVALLYDLTDSLSGVFYNGKSN